KSEYTLSEDDEHYVVALFQQLLEATRQGNEILPIHFNAEQYKSSDVYLLKEQAENQANDYLNFKEEQEKAREQMKRLEEQKQRPWYEKTWDGVKNFTGELTGYYDYIRASEGVDPVTGAELTTSQRVTAGAMAAAGFIPVVGWAGRIVKGGGAIYKTAKGIHAADQALDVYLNAKTFSNLEKAELGIYGLVSVNGFNEYILGKDMFGNELTDLQRQQSLYYSILGPALLATPFIPSLVKNGKVVTEETIGKLHQLTLKTKTGAISFGRELQGGLNVLLQNPRSNLAFSSIGNSPINVMNPMKILKDIDQGMSKFSFGDIRSSAKSAGSTIKYTQVENVAVKQTFTDEEIESIKKFMQSNPESNIKDYLKNTPPQYTSSFDDIRKVLGGQSELAGDMHQAGHLNKATLDFLLEDVMTVVSKDSSLSERALAGFFLINKPGKVVDRIYDSVGDAGKVGNKKVAVGEDIITQRVSKVELDLTPKNTPFKSLSRDQKKKIKEKIANRTITKEEYNRYQWDKRFSKRRAAGVNEFWKQEKKRILDAEPTTRNWTIEQTQEILKGKKPKHNEQSIIGHHTYNAMNYPHISNRGEIIFPVTSKEHLKGWHGGSYSKNAPGKPVNPNFLEEF
ncbi:hypothetical protein FS935_19180, partial [Metabacillus litoralis]